MNFSKYIIVVLCIVWSVRSFSKDILTIELSSKGNDISFDQEVVQVKFQKKIKLKFVNKADHGSHIGHNIAILKPGSSDAVIADLQKSNYDLVRIRSHPSIIVMSKTLNPGEWEVLEFVPEKPDSYPYLCLMPGHSDVLNMKGILTVIP